MIEMVKDAIVTTQQLPPLATAGDVEGLRSDIVLLCGLFLALLGGLYAYARGLREEMRAEAKILSDSAIDEAKDVERRTTDAIRAVEQRLTESTIASERRMIEAVTASEHRMSDSIMTYASRLADAAENWHNAKDDIWKKIDEAINYRVTEARTLATRGDLAALEERIDGRIEAARLDSREDRRLVIEQMETRLRNKG